MKYFFNQQKTFPSKPKLYSNLLLVHIINVRGAGGYPGEGSQVLERNGLFQCEKEKQEVDAILHS